MVQTYPYNQISQDEAKRMMEQDDGHVIVDVRRQDEYDEGHIAGAILIPNETIENDPPEELSDYEQIILVYCRSGRRSKEASQKLADMGYKNVYEFGGIIDWTGDIVKEEETQETTVGESEMSDKTVTFRFESFDGGGPYFNVIIDDESIVSYSEVREYYSEDHDMMTGSGFDEVFTFTGIKPGETDMLIEERSPIADNLDRKFKVIINDDLSVSIEEVSVTEVNG
jgi:rhodanese-related sulfurtransferase